MSKLFPDQLLRRLRNEIDFGQLMVRLDWPHKRRHEQLVFVCPLCQESLSAVNPRTNLARCFSCETNFNPIDFTMAVRECDFVEAVHLLEPWLPPPTNSTLHS